MIFWIVVLTFALANIVFAWSASFSKDDPFDRPRALSWTWVKFAANVGLLGFLVIPAMFYWRYGFWGAGLAGGAYLVSGVVISLALKKFTG